MITFEDREDGQYIVVTEDYDIGLLYEENGRFSFLSDNEYQVFSMEMIQAISKKLEELNGGVL